MISVIMPVYNGEKYLRQSIESVIQQTYKDWELIIVNDCSIDNSRNIMQSYADTDSRIRIVDNGSNLKLPMSLNAGFRQAKGKYLTWTSDDNLYKPNALEELSRYLDYNSEIGLVYSDMDFVDVSLNFIKEQSLETDMIYYGDCVGASFMYRREVIDKVGEYEPDMFLVEDYEYWIRVSKKFKIGHINKNLYIYRVHGNSLTGTRKKDINKQLYRLRKRHMEYLISNVTGKYKEMLFLEMLTQNTDDYEFLSAKFWKKYEDVSRYEWVRTSDKIDSDKSIVIFGAGIIANRAIDYFGRERIECIIDNSKDRIGMKLQGIDIVSLDGYINDMGRDRNSQVVIAVGNNYVLAIAEQLKNNGISEFCWFKAIENCVKETI
jgi:glycosyltransferase involved in cell wall biosynthesis